MNSIKIVVITVLFVLAFASCRKEANYVETDPPMLDSSGVVTYMGEFGDGPFGTVRGTVQVVMQDSTLAVSLKKFSSSGGPDLHVYLSKEVQPVNFIDLGSLRSITGDQAYTIVGSPDLATYRYVLIHCKAYNHLFGSAALEPVN